MRIHAIHMGPLLQMVEEEKTEDEEGSEDSEPLLEPGDHLFATVSTPKIPIPVFAATATMSQQLAENVDIHDTSTYTQVTKIPKQVLKDRTP